MKAAALFGGLPLLCGFIPDLNGFAGLRYLGWFERGGVTAAGDEGQAGRQECDPVFGLEQRIFHWVNPEK
jgi:hypothetical protein